MRTIGQLAIEEPKAIAVLEKLHIDYCCHGNRSIEDACRDAGIGVEELERAIGFAPAETSGRDWSKATLTELQQFIVDTHHVFTRDMLGILQQLAVKVADRHGAIHPEVLAVRTAVSQLVADLMPHMMKEEVILFPFIEQLESGVAPASPFGTVRNPIHMMMMEHDAAAEVLATLRAVTNAYELPGDACISFRALYERLQDFDLDLRRHIHLENNVLFPRAAALEETQNL